GDEAGRVRVPEARGEWKWIAMAGGTLFGLAGEKSDPPETTVVRSKHPAWSWGELSKGYSEQPQIPWGFGETVFAYDMKAGKLLWTYRDPAKIDSRAMAIGGDRVFFYSPEAHLGCLDEKTGTVSWVNDDAETRRLINQEGQGLSSTPGFRTACYCVYTPKALFFEAQTQMNLVAVSKDDGHLLWHHKKTTSNPNVIYVDGNALAGVGTDGSTLVLNPQTGDVIEDLGFKKRSCARLTATPDSMFCRGYPDGVTRYDRATKAILFDGSMRPACNDGVIGANGLLYIGPWLCDCNLSLMGTVALCSAGTSPSPDPAAQRLDVNGKSDGVIESLDASAEDWSAYRGGSAHTGGTSVKVTSPLQSLWVWEAPIAFTPTAPVTAGGLVFFAGDDGVVRALDAAGGTLRWMFQTGGPVLEPPTIWEGRAYVGSGDGFVYALEAATGRLLWRFRAAPVERRIAAYGALCSTWPVNSGVLVKDGIAYCAAGIIDYDGTYLCALDARTGSSGHLNEKLRKGVSAQGNLTFLGDALYMAGGNIISPARYLVADGRYDGPAPHDGSPESNRGEEIGVLANEFLVLGGRLRYSAIENVVNPGMFWIARGPNDDILDLSKGHSVPAWDDGLMVATPDRESPPRAYETKTIVERARNKDKQKPRLPQTLWNAKALEKSQTVTLALSRDSVIAVCRTPRERDLRPVWKLYLLNRDTGTPLCEQTLPSAARPNAVAIDRDSRVLVSLADGGLCGYGGSAALEKYLASLIARASSEAERRGAIERMVSTLQSARDSASREFLIATVQNAGIDLLAGARQASAVTAWRLLGPVPWDNDKNTLDRRFVKEPEVELNRPCKIAGGNLTWERYVTVDANGMVDLGIRRGEGGA
ncbi:MAG: PQQ-binding-like beta-propeller repeat protein, partial [Candidatus Hydrogenedentes bacterium]|nr:PQQ-binding-like beta-propeller repeat protein [Candidatus Hydrogenedentota bacterium]